LAQTYQTLQWHYGSVDFKSAANEGTTFRFSLPLTATRAEESDNLSQNGEVQAPSARA